MSKNIPSVYLLSSSDLVILSNASIAAKVVLALGINRIVYHRLFYDLNKIKLVFY